MGKFSKGQDYPSEYYNVINKDSLYVFSSDTHILFFSSPGEDGNFIYLSNIRGNFTSSTNMAFNDEYFIVENSDTLFLFDISEIYLPSLLSTTSFEFAIGQVYGFGPYFVVKVADTLKLLEINNNSLEVIEDTLLVWTGQPLFKYPYIIMRRNIYKYVENFGAYQIYFMNHEGDAGMIYQFLAEDQVVYTTIIYSPPPFPPTICGIRSRLIQEPDFSFVFINNWWADCLPAYIVEYFEASKKYIYIWEYLNPPHDNKAVVNFAGETLYRHLSWEYKLKLTDIYLFQLWDDILYSTPSDPDSFNVLEFSITFINHGEVNPTEYQLIQNYPNPFNPYTIIEYRIQNTELVTLKIYDVLGNEITTLVNGENSAGRHKAHFNAASLPSGIYFYQLRSGSFVETKKMVVLK